MRSRPERRQSCQPIRWLGVALLLAILHAGAGAATAAVQPSEVVDAVRRLQPELTVAGQGRLRMYGFHIYDARLLVPPQGLVGERLTAQPFALDLRYARAFRAADIARRTREEMERLEVGTAAERKAWEVQLARLLPDVRDNDHLTGLYQPGRGTTFLLNGTPIGEVAGEAFAQAFFAIWLDPRTAAPAVRQSLLGTSRP